MVVAHDDQGRLGQAADTYQFPALGERDHLVGLAVLDYSLLLNVTRPEGRHPKSRRLIVIVAT